MHHRRATPMAEHHIDAGWASCARERLRAHHVAAPVPEPPAHRAGRGACTLPRRRRTISSCLRARAARRGAVRHAAVARPPAGDGCLVARPGGDPRFGFDLRRQSAAARRSREQRRATSSRSTRSGRKRRYTFSTASDPWPTPCTSCIRRSVPPVRWSWLTPWSSRGALPRAQRMAEAIAPPFGLTRGSLSARDRARQAPERRRPR